MLGLSVSEGRVGLANSAVGGNGGEAEPVPWSCDETIGYNAIIGSPPPDANNSL